MKRSFGFALMLVLFAAPAFAGNKPSTVDIPIKWVIPTASGWPEQTDMDRFRIERSGVAVGG